MIFVNGETFIYKAPLESMTKCDQVIEKIAQSYPGRTGIFYKGKRIKVYGARILKVIMSDNVKFISELERLLNQKQNDYGDFDHTSYVMVGIMEKYLSIHNNQDVKIPLKFFGIFMIFLKLWRVMQSENYKKDSFDDINGYAELLRRLVIDENSSK